MGEGGVEGERPTPNDLFGNATFFATGNEAIAYGALMANCRAFAGYPITPATEILETMGRYLPLLGGTFVQTEDEIAAIAVAIGASWNGVRSMTATSGPGFSLMQENLGYAIMTESPVVVVDVQRSGPSTGQPTKAAQGDFYQARWGTHGDHASVVLAPGSVQESFDLAVTAFNFADKYRTPVVLLTDGALAHLREPLRVPDQSAIELVERTPVTIDREKYQPFRTGYRRASKVPEMDVLGDQYHTHLTGLTHDQAAHPATTDPGVHARLVRRLYDKIIDNREDLTLYREHNVEECDVLLVAYGICVKSCLEVVAMSKAGATRRQYGLLQLQTLWPFPKEVIYEHARRVDKMVSVELSRGQLVHKVFEYSQGLCDVQVVSKIGGELVTPQEILRPRIVPFEYQA
ncbi:MAG: 2-oxoacid:acceptor oxidoreductase subunit alpha [Promethearchaeota archaeon]